MYTQLDLGIVAFMIGYVLNYYPTHPVYDYYRILYLYFVYIYINLFHCKYCFIRQQMQKCILTVKLKITDSIDTQEQYLNISAYLYLI